MTDEEITQCRIVLFDGVCNLCNESVIFILKREKTPIFQFASIQSDAGQRLLEWCGLPRSYNQAVVLIDRGELFLGSTAALRIGKNLMFPWSTLSGTALLVPEFIRDWVYKQIATHRYRWFGRRDMCMVPAAHWKARFLE